MTHYRYLVTVEYSGVFTSGDYPEVTDPDDLDDCAIDSALEGFAKDRTVVDVAVTPLEGREGE